MKRKTIVASLVMVIVAGAVVLGGVSYYRLNHIPSVPLASPVAVSNAPDAPMAFAVDFSGIVTQSGAAVVNIDVIGDMRDTAPLDPDDPIVGTFRRLCPECILPERVPQVMRRSGTGFIVSDDGRILTNAHVVEGAREVTVQLNDRREFKARVLGADRQSDIAVLEIQATGLPVVQLGRSADIKVGQPVLAIGSPYGFENTATAGIISATSRLTFDNQYVSFIQSDVAVNPGNSGGPLFNLQGQVIGINSWIFTQTGGYQGLSFAIPIDFALKIAQTLVTDGQVERGSFGISVREMNRVLADALGMENAEGALIGHIEKGSAADKGGLRRGDVIVRVNDVTIHRYADLQPLLANAVPETVFAIEVLRGGQAKQFSVTAEKQKDSPEIGQPQGRLGLAVRALNADELRRVGETGLLVEAVDGPAIVADIRPGDVLLSFNGVSVTSPEQLNGLVDKAGKNVAVLIMRGGGDTAFIPMTLN